ncbi:MAG TPA: hypothetical protein VGV87_24920 [Blastocatellia bacterium]|nr:hypothetical protein [Blastocatellia bacterium]
MRKRSRVIANIVYLMVLVQFVMIGIIRAQQNGPTGPPSIKDPKSETRDRQDREATLRSAELGAAVDKIDQKRIDATLDQMKQDFRRIQIVRNELVRNLLANKPFDYKLISDEVAEINKRADRLKTALMSKVPGEKEKTEKTQEVINSEELKRGLVKLCHLIDSFVENPVLKNPGTSDVQQLTRASADLLGIIELSDNIRKNALRLNNISR